MKLGSLLAMLVLAVLMTAFYTCTGLVFDEGGFGFRLVLKPQPGLGWYFGGGEHGGWARSHPGEALPWWIDGGYTTLISGDWEQGSPWWRSAYALGLLATPLIWAGLLIIGGFTIARSLLRTRQQA